MNTKSKTLLGAGLVALGAVSTVTPADANIPKADGYNANFCVPTSGSVSILERSNTFGIVNISPTATATVECPIIVDIANSPHISGLVVQAYDRNPSFDVTCTLYLLGNDGTTLWHDTQHTSGSGQAIQSLAPNLNPLSVANSHANMECTIPQS